MEQILFNDILFNSVIVVLNGNSIDMLREDLANNNMFIISSTKDSTSDEFKAASTNAPPEIVSKIEGLVFTIQFTKNFNA